MKFRKKPIEVEAHLCGGPTAWRDLAKWCGGLVLKDANGRKIVAIIVPTPAGGVRANVGDWIIRNAQGEFYRCTPDAFEATYEPVQGE